MPIEIRMLAYSAALCLLLAVPYTLGFIVQRGLLPMVGNREDFEPGKGWIGRAHRAHLNMVENFLPFAALALAVVVTNHASDTTAFAVRLFFYARVGHAIVYIAGIPWLRTLAYALGLIATLMLLGALLS